jgi:trehalose-6-phosphate synthase
MVKKQLALRELNRKINQALKLEAEEREERESEPNRKITTPDF